jgi:DNA-binding MarR family transcriptional regulator
MTRLVATLERARLVSRAAAANDGRSSLVSATEDGKTLLEQLRGDYVSELADRLGALDRVSFERIVAALPALEAVVAESAR